HVRAIVRDGPGMPGEALRAGRGRAALAGGEGGLAGRGDDGGKPGRVIRVGVGGRVGTITGGIEVVGVRRQRVMVVVVDAVGGVGAAAVVAEGLDQVAVVGGDVLEAGAGGADADCHAGAAVAAAGGDAGAADVVRPDVHLDDVLTGQR